MKLLARIALCWLFAGGAMAQRGGGFHVGSVGGGFHGGSISGGSHGGSVGAGFHGGIGYGGFRGGFSYGGYRPYYGLGYGYWPGYGDYYDYYPYASSPYESHPYGASTYGYGSEGYNTSPNVTVVNPPTPAYVAHPVMHQYDQYGQEVKPADAGSASSGPPASASAPSGGIGSPVYLIAFQDHTIQAAAAYWVDGKTLHYVTLQHAEKQAPLDTVDRDFSQQLNGERRVPFQLPAR